MQGEWERPEGKGCRERGIDWKREDGKGCWGSRERRDSWENGGEGIVRRHKILSTGAKIKRWKEENKDLAK